MSMMELTPVEKKLDAGLDKDVSRALAVSDRGSGLVFRNATEVTEFAKMMALSKTGIRSHLRGNPGACLAIVVQAVEWGMSPYAVASKSYFVNDQIAFESQLVQAVILKRAPIKGRIKFDFIGAGQERQVRAWARLADDPDEIVEITTPKLKDIKPQNSPLWKNDPDQQQCYYAGRALARRHFPDVILGVYDKEELEGVQRHDGSYDAVPQNAPPRGMVGKLDRLSDDAPPERQEKVFTQHTDEAGQDEGDADPEPAPNNDNGAEYAPLLANLRESFEDAETRKDLQGLLDAAGWVKDAPDHVRKEADQAFAEELDRIAHQTAGSQVPDPHGELKDMAKRKAAGGKAVYNRWYGSTSDAQRAVLDPMTGDLSRIATDADKQAGRA